MLKRLLLFLVYALYAFETGAKADLFNCLTVDDNCDSKSVTAKNNSSLEVVDRGVKFLLSVVFLLPFITKFKSSSLNLFDALTNKVVPTVSNR